MYNKLKRVHAAASKKGILSIYSMVCIRDGMAIASDGVITLAVPVPELEGHNVVIKADKFIKALQTASDNMHITTTDHNLIIKDGKFRAQIALSQELFPHVEIAQNVIPCSGIIDALRAVQPFIGSDASHRWATGCLLRDGYAFATNNSVLCRYKMDSVVTEMNIPAKAVAELVKCGEEPIAATREDNSATFMYADGSWLHTTLLAAEWPPVDHFFDGLAYQYLDPRTKTEVDKVSVFANETLPRISFGPDGISSEHAAVSDMVFPVAHFHAVPLREVLAIATEMDMTRYPKPCPWRADRLEGVLMGLRV
jgi:DNA polymerase III sliding clamp (beta) subunit (PCNA family)